MDDNPCDVLGAAFVDLVHLRSALPSRPLDIAERRERGGRLFPGGPGLVVTVGRALCAEPGRLAGVDGQALLDKQRLACRLRFLRDCLLDLAQLAGDGFLRVQSDAIAEAQGVLRRDRDVPPAPGEASAAAERTLALVPAYLIVHGYQEAIRRHKQRARQRRKDAAPPPAPRTRAPKEVRAAQAVRQGRKETLAATFREVAGRLAPPIAAARRTPAPGARPPSVGDPPAAQLLPPPAGPPLPARATHPPPAGPPLPPPARRPPPPADPPAPTGALSPEAIVRALSPADRAALLRLLL